MPTYDYQCENCDNILADVFQKFEEQPLKNCPRCGKNCLHRVIYGGAYVHTKDVKTIGQLADKNWRSMGYYQRSEIESKNKKVESSPYSSFGSASKKEINKMTTEQKKKYIITGEK